MTGRRGCEAVTSGERRQFRAKRRGERHRFPWLCSYLVALGFFSFGVRCATFIWDSDISHTGKVLSASQTEVSGSTGALVIPSAVEVGYGLKGNWELRGRIGDLGLLETGGGPEWLPASRALVGAGLGAGKGLMNEGENRIVLFGEVDGFASDFHHDSSSLSGGWIGLGGALSQYPLDWLGIYLHLKVSGLMTSHGDRYLRIRPGIGFSFEPRELVIRLSFAPEIRVLSHEVTDPASYYHLYELPFQFQAGIQFGLRWPVEANQSDTDDGCVPPVEGFRVSG